MANRTYSTFSYADKHFWAKTGLADRVRKQLGDAYVDQDTQLGNIIAQARQLGHFSLAKDLRSYTEEGEAEDRE